MQRAPTAGSARAEITPPALGPGGDERPRGACCEVTVQTSSHLSFTITVPSHYPSEPKIPVTKSPFAVPVSHLSAGFSSFGNTNLPFITSATVSLPHCQSVTLTSSFPAHSLYSLPCLLSKKPWSRKKIEPSFIHTLLPKPWYIPPCR